MDMVEGILLRLLRAVREGDWTLQMFALYQLIPWCFSYNHINYSHYLSVYYASMSNLPIENPEVYRAYMQGSFSVQLSSENPFGRILVDQRIDETVIKVTKCQGGITI